jgi:hypothetical protein
LFQVGRILLEQPLNGEKALEYALGVIDPVHPDTHEDGLNADFLQQVRPLLLAAQRLCRCRW